MGHLRLLVQPSARTLKGAGPSASVAQSRPTRPDAAPEAVILGMKVRGALAPRTPRQTIHSWKSSPDGSIIAHAGPSPPRLGARTNVSSEAGCGRATASEPSRRSGWGPFVGRPPASTVQVSANPSLFPSTRQRRTPCASQAPPWRRPSSERSPPDPLGDATGGSTGPGSGTATPPGSGDRPRAGATASMGDGRSTGAPPVSDCGMRPANAGSGRFVII